MGLIFTIEAANAGAPVASLTLAEFSVNISAVKKSDLSVTTPVVAAAMTLDAGNGFYLYSNSDLNSDLYLFFASVEYTGASTLDSVNWQVPCMQNMHMEMLLRGGQTNQSLDSIRIQIGNLDSVVSKAAALPAAIEASLTDYGVATGTQVSAAVSSLRGDELLVNLTSVANAVNSVINHLEKVRGVVCGDLRIRDNQLTFYNEAGTEIYRFNLYNKEGTPAESSVYERRRV